MKRLHDSSKQCGCPDARQLPLPPTMYQATGKPGENCGQRASIAGEPPLKIPVRSTNEPCSQPHRRSSYQTTDHRTQVPDVANGTRRKMYAARGAEDRKDAEYQDQKQAILEVEVLVDYLIEEPAAGKTR